jgi:glycosyltransferase involved in cell wall biosynthesis
MEMQSKGVSGFVITCNRASLVETCLRSIRFVDELIVIDKSSTDGTRAIAERYADQLITVPWSPTVEETRAGAAALCRHDWIVHLDDDELLSPEAITFLRRRRPPNGPEAYYLPKKHYILGRFDPAAYYWPEHHPQFFRKGAVSFSNTVHGGVQVHTERVERIAPETGICIHHLSHLDTAQWVEKANRYTSRPDRVRCEPEVADLIGFAHARIDHWLSRTGVTDRSDYAAAVALLRAVYDMIDRVKSWEQAQGFDAAVHFAAICAELGLAYDALERRTGIRTSAEPLPRSVPDRLRGLLAGLGERLAPAAVFSAALCGFSAFSA